MSSQFLPDAARRWPRPGRPWVLAMCWHDLLFAHWPVDPEPLRRQLPPGVELETWEGQAWVGVVPFTMTGVRPRFLPAVPGPGAFAEVNVRTYARAGGRSGVWFLSLDAGSRVAVEAARLAFHLPYYHARFDVGRAGGDLVYRSRRRDRRGPPAELSIRYRPTGPVLAQLDPLAAWLTARYCLFAWDGRRVLRLDIDHRPWPLQPASAVLDTETLLAGHGIARRPDDDPVLHFARRLEVVAWAATPAISPAGSRRRPG